MTASNAKSPISVLRRKEDCEQSNFERIDMTSQTWWPNMYSRYAKPSIPLHLTSYCRVQIPTPRGVMCTVGVQILKKWACTQTLLHFSFRSFGKHGRSRERGEHASEASEHLFALAVPENFCVFLPNQKPEWRRPFWTGLVRHCPQGLFSPFFSFLRAIFFRPFRLSLAPTICPWVSEDGSLATEKITHGTQLFLGR